MNIEQINELVIYVGIIVAFGVILGHLVARLNLPSISGYIIAGLIVGPSLLDIIPQSVITGFTPISDIALAFLAFSVGTELFIPKLKKEGMSILVLGIVEVLITFALVSVALYLFGMDVYIAILLGALASSTSPAPILLIKKQFKLKEKLVDDTIAVCAIDDGLGIILFGVVSSFVNGALNSTGESTFIEFLTPAVVELAVSTFFGILIGISLGFLINTFTSNKDEDMNFYIEVIFVSVILSLSFAYLFEGSPILLPLIAGFTFTNIVDKSVFDIETKVVDIFSKPFLIFFFTLAGIQIDVSAITSIWYIAIVYVIFRGIGKIAGGFFGSKFGKFNKTYQKKMGFLLLPLGGVEIGLALITQEILSQTQGNEVKLIVLSGTLVYSILGIFFASKTILHKHNNHMVK